jgi:ribonuclease BN (tRNA processing enzyme)
MLPELGLVFDAGTAAFRIPQHLVTDELTILLSHAHLDHICGLTYLLVPLLDGRLRRIVVRSTAETLTAVREHLFSERVFPLLPENLVWEPLVHGEQLELQDRWTIQVHQLISHPGGSLGFRLDDRSDSVPQRLLAYITDTTVDGTYDDFVRGVPLLIHECYFPDSGTDWAIKTGHSSTGMVAGLAARTGVGEVVLVHVDPLSTGIDPLDMPSFRRVFPQGRLACDGDRLTIRESPAQ